MRAAHAAHYQKQPNQKMGRRPKQTFLQRRHADGQQREKIPNITNYQRNENQNYSGLLQGTSTTLYLTVQGQSEWPSSQNLQTINSGVGVEKMEPSCTVCGNVN